MASLNSSDYFEDLVLQTFFSDATVYLALYTTNPTSADVGQEVLTSGTAYARQAISFANAASGSVANDSVITFPAATSNWGIVSYFGVRDALTAGNLLAFGEMDPVREGTTGTELRIPVAGIVLAFA